MVAIPNTDPAQFRWRAVDVPIVNTNNIASLRILVEDDATARFNLSGSLLGSALLKSSKKQLLTGGLNLDTSIGFVIVRAVVQDSVNNRALVVDGAFDTLIAVDLSTGNRTELSGSSAGSGQSFGSPLGVALDSANNRALVVDDAFNALITIDLVSGDRVTLSQ